MQFLGWLPVSGYQDKTVTIYLLADKNERLANLCWNEHTQHPPSYCICMYSFHLTRKVVTVPSSVIPMNSPVHYTNKCVTSRPRQQVVPLAAFSLPKLKRILSF